MENVSDKANVEKAPSSPVTEEEIGITDDTVSEESVEESAEETEINIGFDKNENVNVLKAYISSNKIGKMVRLKKFQRHLKETRDMPIGQLNSEQLMLLSLMVQYEEQMAAERKENYTRFVGQSSLIH